MLVTIIASITSILAILLITPGMVEQRFVEQAKLRHFENFSSLLSRYKTSSPDWNTSASASAYYHNQILADRQKQLSRAHSGAPGRHSNHRPGRNNTAPPLASQNLRFVLASPAGYVVLPFYDYQPGQKLNKADMTRAEPVYANQELVGYALASGEIKLSDNDKTYLQTLKHSLLISALIALLIAILISYLLTRSIQARLTRLMQATQILAEAPSPSNLAMPGKDEISLLAGKFDQMSAQLTQQFNTLTESHQTISAQAKNLHKLSYTDELTQLANRRYFNDFFESAVKSAVQEEKTLCIIVCDIDHFKKVNDHFSHQIGDQVLQQVAGILQSSVREQDMAARYGGEVLMPDTDKLTALKIADRIRTNIESAAWHKIALGLNITMSSGVACLDECADNKTAATLFKQADSQLYKAKSKGRNRVCG